MPTSGKCTHLSTSGGFFFKMWVDSLKAIWLLGATAGRLICCISQCRWLCRVSHERGNLKNLKKTVLNNARLNQKIANTVGAQLGLHGLKHFRVTTLAYSDWIFLQNASSVDLSFCYVTERWKIRNDVIGQVWLCQTLRFWWLKYCIYIMHQTLLICFLPKNVYKKGITRSIRTCNLNNNFVWRTFSTN